MSLTRPVYQATIENVTAGWSYTITAGDVPNPAAGMWVIDPLTMSWTFENGQVPSQLEPDEATFSILAEDQEDLPEIGLGDIVLVKLDRPTAGDPIPYMHFAGRIRNARLLQVPGLGVTVTVVCTDFMADLASIAIPKKTAFATQDSEDRLLAIAELADINMITNLRAQFWSSVDPAAPDGATALALMEKIVTGATRIQGTYLVGAGTYSQPGTHVLRSVYDPVVPSTISGEYSKVVSHPDSLVYYVLQTIPRYTKATELPFQLDRTAGLTSVEPTADAEENDAIIVLSARKIPVGSDRTKARDTSINQVVLTKWDQGPERTQLSGWDDLIEAMGPNPRALETSGPSTQFDDNFDNPDENPYLPDRASITAWSFPDLTIPVRDDTFTDAQLDNYAGMLYPHVVMQGEPMVKNAGRPLLVIGVADDVNVDGLAMSGDLAACTFAIQRGQLTITPKVQARADPIVSTYDFATSLTPRSTYELGITWAQVAADPAIEPTTWATLADELTWDEFRLIEN